MKEQLNLFGPPENLENLSADAQNRDDRPVPAERELLWPAPHCGALSHELLERLYGDLPKRTRLTVLEVCRRLRRGHSHIYDLIECGSLDACDDRHPNSDKPAYSIYRYSVVRFLFHREFVDGSTRCGMPAPDLKRCTDFADQLRAEMRGRVRE